MKTKWIYVVCCFGFFACNNETSTEETTASETEQVDNEANAEGFADEEERSFKLGPRPETPMLNMYGEDSIDADGSYVYAGRDTIWLDNE